MWAWVSIDNSGAAVIGKSFNVSSITDNAAGDFTVNFAREFSSAHYAVMLGAALSDTFGISQTTYAGTAATAALVRVSTMAAADPAVFGDKNPTTVFCVGH